MNIIRGSGIDGISGIPDTTVNKKMIFLRPLLQFSRESLRAMLHSKNYTWIDDPTNTNHDYLRSRVRSALPILANLGATPEKWIMLADHARRAKAGFDQIVHDFMNAHTISSPIEMTIDLSAWQHQSYEVRLRILRTALRQLTQAKHPPRLSPILALESKLHKNDFTSMNLAGILFQKTANNRLELSTEPPRSSLGKKIT